MNLERDSYGNCVLNLFIFNGKAKSRLNDPPFSIKIKGLPLWPGGLDCDPNAGGQDSICGQGMRSHKLSNHLILCCLLLLPSVLPSIWVFSKELALRVRWPKYWCYSFIISSSNEYFFRIDWFYLLVVQGTLKSLLQHHNSKVTILQLSAFYMVHLSHPHMTTGKNHSLDSLSS